MSVEKGQNVLLYIGSGASTPTTASDISIDVTGGVTKLKTLAEDFVADGVKVGQVVHVTGFANNPDFHAIASAVAALEITLVSIVDGDGNPLVLTTEAAGAEITVNAETFTLVKGQDDTQKAVAASSIDASTKDTGKWGASLSGTNRMTITAGGKVVWPATNDIKALIRELEDQGEVWLKIVLDLSGCYWYGLFAVTQLNIGGAKDGATTYSLSFENKLRPNFVDAA